MESATTGRQQPREAFARPPTRYINRRTTRSGRVYKPADDTAAMKQRVRARGHEHVTAEHASTLELTSDDWLTPAGDCILAVEATAVPSEFDAAFVEACRSEGATITATLRVGDREQTVEGTGHPALTFESDRSMVARTSDYVDDRTVMVGADAAAADVDRGIVSALAAGEDLECVLAVEA